MEPDKVWTRAVDDAGSVLHRLRSTAAQRHVLPEEPMDWDADFWNMHSAVFADSCLVLSAS
jgi:hypothetical protein